MTLILAVSDSEIVLMCVGSKAYDVYYKSTWKAQSSPVPRTLSPADHGTQESWSGGTTVRWTYIPVTPAWW